MIAGASLAGASLVGVSAAGASLEGASAAGASLEGVGASDGDAGDSDRLEGAGASDFFAGAGAVAGDFFGAGTGAAEGLCELLGLELMPGMEMGWVIWRTEMLYG